MKLKILLLYLAIAGVNAVVHDFFLDFRFPEQVRELHEQVVNAKAPAPVQYRVFTYYVAQKLVDAGFSVRYAHDFLRFLFTFLSGVLLHLFLRKWFVEKACMTGVLIFYSVLPVTYMWYFSQPMDLPNLFFFIMGYIFIRDRKDISLFMLLFIAMFNRETAILLVLVWLFYRYDEMGTKEFLIKLAVLTAVGLGVYVGLRKYFGIKEYYSDAYYLNFNITDTRNWFYIVLMFNVFLVLSWSGWHLKPKFLKRSALMLPFFVIIHFTMTVMREARLWLPVFPIMLALGLFSFMPEDVLAKKEAEPGLKTGFKNIFLKVPSWIMYAVMLSGFLVFFVYFNKTYDKLHLKELAIRNQAARFTEMSESYLKMNMFDDAVNALNSALAVNPVNAETHYKLAKIYNYQKFDKEKALYHYRLVLQQNPYFYDKKLVDWEIKRLERQ